jgi:hypothetical protein
VDRGCSTAQLRVRRGTDRRLSRSVKYILRLHSDRLFHLRTWNSQGNSQSFRCGDNGDQSRAAPGKGCQIFALVIRNALFPTAKDYANPFEGQGSHCPMVIHAFAALLPIICSRPHRVADGVTSPFMKTLPQKLGAGPAKMDPLLFPALLYHWRDPGVCLDLAGIAIALSL